MIGVVLVSHSKRLAMAIRELVLQMVGPDFPMAVAAGVGDDHEEIGTDAVHVAETLKPFCQGDGAVVLMDLGSAVLSAQMALELLEADGIDDPARWLRLSPAPIVEAAVAAAVQAKAGADLDAVAAEAAAALAPKQAQTGGAEDGAAAGEAATPLPSAGERRQFEVVIDNPHGLHARPAATLVQSASRFRAEVSLSNLTAGRGPCSARSLIGVGLLQARKGDRIRFDIRGDDAEAAATQLEALAKARFGEAEEIAPLPSPAPAAPKGGIGASDGVAIGRPLLLAQALPTQVETAPGTVGEEKRKLDAALRQVAENIRKTADIDGGAAQILAAQALMLSDPVLVGAVGARLDREGGSALAAWQKESAAAAASYAAMDDDYLRARAADLRDIAARVSRALAGLGQTARIAPQPPAILLADELLPSEAMACDPHCVLGVLARSGSPTAHAAIIIRTLGIPMVIGGPLAESRGLRSATVLAIDGTTGEVWVDPAGPAMAEIAGRRQAYLAERAAFEKAKGEPAVTHDGQRIEVLANVGSVADAEAARDNGAEGVGLLRTEFLYLPHRERPSEGQQAASLAAVLEHLGPGPVVVRTPDIGADKPLAFMPSAPEHNPFLGVRGLRLSLRHPDFFASNLRAILRAGHGRDLWIMFPMVTSPEEMAEARALTEAAHRALDAAGIVHCWPAKVGMMVEVPAAALMADRFAHLADFFSIGTNDLTQYILAAERGNGDLGGLQDALHPAVLRAIRALCQEASPAGCHVSVCGDAASDPVAAALMVGAGVRSLSVRPNQVAAVKAQLRRASAAELRLLAEHAMLCDNGADVRRLAAKTLAGARPSSSGR